MFLLCKIALQYLRSSYPAMMFDAVLVGGSRRRDFASGGSSNLYNG
jgi:hypothetical protein